MKNEFEDFIKELSDEIHILLNSEDEYGKSRFNALVNLVKTLKTHQISKEYFNVKNKYLSDFRTFLSTYNTSGNEAFIDEINERAARINTYLLNTEQKNIIQTYELEINDIEEMKEKIRLLKNEQEVLQKKNNIFLEKYNEINIIFEELKNKNSAYSQLIDEDSNQRIRNLYNDIYADEIKLANKYRNWALGIFAIVGVVLLLGFLNLSIQNWNHLRDSTYINIPLGWDSLLKTLMLFSLTTPAWYLTKESSKHRKVAYKAKILGTELASFPLYAREFKDEDRLELRKALSDRFFGQELYGDVQTKNSSSDNSLEQIKLLTEANKALAESVKNKQNI